MLCRCRTKKKPNTNSGNEPIFFDFYSDWCNPKYCQGTKINFNLNIFYFTTVSRNAHEFVSCLSFRCSWTPSPFATLPTNASVSSSSSISFVRKMPVHHRPPLSIVIALIAISCIGSVSSFVIAPPWANAVSNPCSSRSWQLIHWPADGECYQIFSQGPCPRSQELAFNDITKLAECRCPKELLYWSATDRYPKMQLTS
jgi:hypothetical protein